ncbi:DUF6049 family protein [Actinomadura madurae]|uniref:DUF6049 family protein n=1 Tax=Actinomadura madurae TaxID=1993 RepID=UPI00355682AE|nr:DUF6049 family protein [Actinomadura madurae]
MNSSQFQNPANGAQPNAASALQTHLGVKKTLIFDQTMNQIVSDGARSASGALLSEQRFLAETAVIAGEAPNAQRTVVVAPDRYWNPADGLAKSLLSYTKGAAWLREVPLRKIESTAPQQRVFNGYPDPYQRYELGDAHLDHTQAIAERAAAFRAVMTGPVKISYERAVLRMESVAWRSSPGRAKRARNELENELKWDMRKVRVVTTKNKRVLMGGSSGRAAGPRREHAAGPGGGGQARRDLGEHREAPARRAGPRRRADRAPAGRARPAVDPGAGGRQRQLQGQPGAADPGVARADVRQRREHHRHRHRLRAYRPAHHGRRTCRTLRGRRSAGHQSEAPPESGGSR